MGADGELLLLLARDLEVARQVLRGLPHADVVVHLVELGMEGGVEAAHGDGEHVLDADGDAAVEVAGEDGLRELVDGVHRRAAEAVDDLAGGRFGKTGEQGDAAGHEHALGVLGEGAAEHQVLHVLGRQLALAREELSDHLGGELVGADADELSFLHPHGAADGVDDHAGRRHDALLSKRYCPWW